MAVIEDVEFWVYRHALVLHSWADAHLRQLAVVLNWALFGG